MSPYVEPDDADPFERVEARIPDSNVVLPRPPAESESREAEDAFVAQGLARVPGRTIALLVIATFGAGMAMIVPMAFSLALRLDELAPGRTDVLGYILGVGSAVTLLVAPLTGILSDRTRSRWGRRRPFTVIGLILGMLSVPIMVIAPNLVILTVGWVLSTVGWGTAAGSIGNWQADRLPPSQRGKVSGLTGLTMQIAPVIGIILVSRVSDVTVLVFAIPAAIAVISVALFVLFAPDADTRGATHPALTVVRLLKSYLFRPREVPDFAWNWAGRFVFFLGLTLTTSFSVFFYAQRLQLSVADVATVLALVSALSVVTATLGSIGGGWVSDRLGRRRPLILVGAALFSVGCGVSAFAVDLPSLIVGSLVSSIGIAVFSAVGQALVLDILPHRETEAGRYMAITTFAQKIPGVIAPLVAPAVLAIGAGQENFTALYLTAAVLALLGGIIIASRVRGAA